MVEVEVVNRSGAELDVEAAVAVAQDVLAAEGIEDGELGLTLVGPDEIRELKRAHLGVDEATDALAFPIDGRDELPEPVGTVDGTGTQSPDDPVGDEDRDPGHREGEDRGDDTGDDDLLTSG